MLFKFLLRNLKKDYARVVLTLLVTILQVFSDLLLIFPLKFVLDKVVNHTDPHVLPLDPLISFFDNIAGQAISGSSHTTTGVILFSVAAIFALGVLNAILSYVELFLVPYIAQNLTARLREQLFEHLQRLPLGWHGQQKGGDLVQRITTDITNIEEFASQALVDLPVAFLTIMVVTSLMLLINAPYFILSIVMLPAFFFITRGYTKGVEAAVQAESKDAYQMANVAAEQFGAIMVSKSFMLEERESLRFKRYVSKNRETRLRVAILQARYTPFVNLFDGIGTAITIGVGVFVAIGGRFSFLFLTIAAGSITLGTAILWYLYTRMLFQPLRDLSRLTNLASIARASAERIEEVLNQAPEVPDSTAPYYGPTKVRGDITFENVKFGYTPDRFVLKGINLRIAAGRKIALAGFPGSGKTTLVRLIPRFYEVQHGSVKIDDTDNRVFPLAVLRQNIGLVPLDPVLFEGSIRENIAVGRPVAGDREITEAAKRVNMHDTIMAWTDGYEMEVHAQGRNLSRSQRQRLLIARAILNDTPILLLDEPTTDLNADEEAEFVQTLDTLIIGRTVLIISHNPSLLNKVDEIIVLKDGQIVERGTFIELEQKNGVLSGLLEEQKRAKLDRVDEKSITAVKPVEGDSPAGVNSEDSEQPPRKARVVIEVDGKIIGERLLDKAALSVGSLSSNDIQVTALRVSRLHAKIAWINGAWLIEGAESTDGLIYQGHRIQQLILTNGDLVYLAPFVAIRYEAMP